MKKHLAVFVIAGLLVSLVACKGPSSKVRPAVKTSFDAVTSRLDGGGSLYLYASAEKVAKTLEELAGKVRAVLESEVPGSQAEKEEILGVFDFVIDFVRKFGLMEISGVGMSSVAMSEDLNHSKLIVHHYEGAGKGFLWQMWEDKPHPLVGLDLLPADTVLAQFSDCRLGRMWQIIKAEVEASGIPKFKKGLESFGQLLDKQGVPMDALLESLGGSMGFLLTLDREKKSAVPLGQASMEIPAPGLAIVLGVRDETLFDFFKSKLAFAEASEDEGVKRLRIPVPPLPIPLQPEVVLRDNLLIIASHGDVTEAMFAAREEGNGLTATEEFKELSRNTPGQGNSFRFVGSRLYEQIMDIQKKAVQASGTPQQEAMGAEQILEMFSKNMRWYGVLQNTDEGLVSTFNHSLDLENIALVSATAAVGIAVAAIIPSLSKAKKD